MFALHADSVSESLVLTQVNRLTRQAEHKRQPFSLLFQSEHAEPMAQGIYRLKHAELGDLELFLVPVERNDTGVCYEAVFS